MGIGVAVAHTFMELNAETVPATDLTQFSTSLLLSSIQTIAFLATLSTFGLYTPTFIGIGIMTSNVQAGISVGNGGGLNSDPHWAPSSIDHRRRAHPRDVSIAVSDTQDKNSYHVAEVLVKKFEEIVEQVNGQYPRFESPGRLPKFAAFSKRDDKKDGSTNVELRDSSTNSNDKTPF